MSQKRLDLDHTAKYACIVVSIYGAFFAHLIAQGLLPIWLSTLTKLVS